MCWAPSIRAWARAQSAADDWLTPNRFCHIQVPPKKMPARMATVTASRTTLRPTCDDVVVEVLLLMTVGLRWLRKCRALSAPWCSSCDPGGWRGVGPRPDLHRPPGTTQVVPCSQRALAW